MIMWSGDICPCIYIVLHKCNSIFVAWLGILNTLSRKKVGKGRAAGGVEEGSGRAAVHAGRQWCMMGVSVKALNNHN